MFFVLSEAKQVPIIPKSALIRKIPSEDTSNGEIYVVKVMTPDGRVEERQIKVNIS